MARITARRIVPLPSLTAVAPSSDAVATLPVGARKYHAAVFKYKDGTANQATMEAGITQVRVLLNGKEQWKLSLARLNILNALDGFAFQAGHVLIPFSRFAARTPQGEEAFGWGTANVASLTVELTLAAVGVEANPALTGWAEIEDVVENIGVILKRRTHSGKAASGAGLFQIQDLPKKANEAYARIHLFTVQATAVAVYADDTEWFNSSRAVANMIYGKQGKAHPANTFSVLFDGTDQVTDVLPMTRNVPNLGPVTVQDFRLDVTMAAGATFDVVAEVVGIPD